MKGYSKRNWLFLGCLLQLMPLLAHAQVEMLIRNPMVPNPTPSAPIRREVHSPVEGGITKPPAGFPNPSKVADPTFIDDPAGMSNFSQGSAEIKPFENILDFWFGFLPGPDFFPANQMPIWFASNPAIDRQIFASFGQDVNQAGRGVYNDWRNTPRGRLALILLLDQFPRHIYRNQPKEFMLDGMARTLVLEGMQRGDDKHLFPIERAFYYLPLQHAEDLDLQNLSVANYQQLWADSPEEIKPEMYDFLQSAVRNQKLIARFGRFPYRNAILGRESTPEETVFLMQWGKY